MNDAVSAARTGSPRATQRGRRLGALEATAIYLCSILMDLGHRAMRRRKRRQDQVSADYDQGEWTQQANARDWEKVATLRQYVERAWITAERTCLIDGTLWKIPSPDYYRFRRQQVAAILKRFAGGADELVEAGSGTGLNLFALALENHWPSLVGLELSSTGRRVAAEAAERFAVADRIEFAEIDLLDPNSPGFERIRGKPVFTYLCLEQLPNDTEGVLRNLLQAGASRVIHIEPSYELLSQYSLRDLASMSYVLRQDYQRTIVKVGRKLEQEGLIKVVALERLYYSPSWRNTPTLMVWEPRTG